MPDVVVSTDVPATMRDGVVLRADVYRPVGDGPFPVLLARLPYDKSASGNLGLLDPLHRARAGFIVVVQDTRGRFASDGAWEPFRRETEDGFDTVRWAAGLPGANGAVGMFGPSYLGNTAWQAALSGAPELRAIAPWSAWSDPADGFYSRGGVRELGTALPWTLITGVDTVMRREADPATAVAAVAAVVDDHDHLLDRVYAELPAHPHPILARHGLPDLEGPTDGTDPARVTGRHEEVAIPTLNVGGWYDAFNQGVLDNFAAMRALGRPAALLVGPWTHLSREGFSGDVNFGVGAHHDVLGLRGRLIDLELAWFRRWLAPDAEDSETVEPAPVLVFVTGRNEWREAQEWPPANVVDRRLHLRADGGLSWSPSGPDGGEDEFTHDPSDPTPTLGGNTVLGLATAGLPAGPVDQSSVEARADVLVYTSEPLEADLEIAGRVTAVLHASGAVASADWIVRLCEVDTAGVSRNLVDGIVRSDSAPGRMEEHSIDLWSLHHVVRAGHRLRVHVAGTSFPRWERNPLELAAAEHEAVTRRVAHDAARPSHLVLPIV